MKVPLETVRREWCVAKGLKEVAFLGKYHGIFRDIFGGEEFKPHVWLAINYDERAVHRGNIINPSEV